jgi:hypothetical protein
MLPGILALFMGSGCGARTLLTIADIGEETQEDDASMSCSDGGDVTLVPLIPNAAGEVSAGSVGIVGTWNAYGDGLSTGALSGPCETAGFPMQDCSSITFPQAGANLPQTDPGTFCLSGTAAPVIGNPDGGMLDYSDIYGIGLSLPFNHTSQQMTYDAKENCVVGFQFDVEGVPPGGFRVQFRGPGFQEANYGTAFSDGGSDLRVWLGTISLLFMSSPPPGQFDATKLWTINFAIPSVVGSSVPVNDFCVSNLQAIVQ